MAEADVTMGRHFCSVVDQYCTAASVEIAPNRTMNAFWMFEVRTTDATVIHVAAESDFSKQLAPAGGIPPAETRMARAIGGALSGA